MFTVSYTIECSSVLHKATALTRLLNHVILQLGLLCSFLKVNSVTRKLDLLILSKLYWSLNISSIINLTSK